MAMIEIKVPTLPESVVDGSIAAWYKNPGDFIRRDEHLLDVETDKVVIEVVAPEDGVLESIQKNPGDRVKAQEVVGLLKTGAEAKEGKEPKEIKERETTAATQPMAAPATATLAQQKEEPAKSEKEGIDGLSPSVRRLLAEKGLEAKNIQGTGKSGRITTEDIEKAAAVTKTADTSARTSATTTTTTKEAVSSVEKKETPETISAAVGQRIEKRVPMTRLRARIAERLIEAQQTAAILTTFNEINMQPVITLRNKYKDSFEKAYGVRLGFMSFFTLAVVESLKNFPIINASIEGNDIIYHGYYDIGIAVSSPRGLVVPVIRNTETLSMAEIEKQIVDYAKKAESGRLSIEEISGGTFTISNGGVF